MKSGRRLRRTLAGVLAAGALLTGAAGAIGAGLALTAGPAHATPEEDCAAVRARDHQIYLNLIASLPPGALIPPEYINPCLTAPTTTPTAAPTTTVGLPGAQAPGGGPNVGANAPTNFPTYNGTPIVPVPTIEVPPIASESPASETGVGAFPNASASAVPSPTPTPGEGTTTDRGPGPIPTDSDSNTAPAQPVPDPAADVATSGEGEDRDRYLELTLIGAAAFTAAGIGVRGRPGPFSPRTPESVLSQVVGTITSPLVAYARGGQSALRVFDPITGGSRFFFLIHDETSSHESVIPVTVPPGGHMSVNPDGTVTVFDADGNPVSTIDAPWAYDANGTPVPTHYEIRDGQLVQVVDTAGVENLLYPILADPELTPEERAALEAQANFIGPMTPEGEQARRDAQNVLAANPPEPADSGLEQLMLGDPNSEVSEPPITETGTGNPVGDAILANQTQEPITSNIGGRDYTTEPADPADSDLGHLMSGDPNSEVSEPPITETGTGNPVGDAILANQTQEPITSNIDGQDYTTEPVVTDTSFTDENGTSWSGTASKVPNVWSWTYTDAQGEEHDLQVTYDEQGRPHRVFDNYTSTLYLYDWSTGEPVLIGDPHYLDPGVAFDQPYTGEIMSFVLPPLRGGRLIAGAVRAEDLIVSNRTTPTRPPTSAPSVSAQSVPRPGAVPPRGIPVIDGTVAPAEHDQPSVPSVNEPARPDPTIPEPSQPTFPGDPDRGEREPSTPGEIGDPGPNLTPGISTPNVPSPGHVEEPSVPTLPDVGQVPVNPDAPGAPQQPGPPEFDPFATDPSTIAQPGVIPSPTDRPTVAAPPLQPDSVEPDVSIPITNTQTDPGGIETGEPAEVRAGRIPIPGDPEGGHGIWDNAHPSEIATMFDQYGNLVPHAAFQQLVTGVDPAFTYYLLAPFMDSGRISIDNWIQELNILQEVKGNYDMLFKPHVSEFMFNNIVGKLRLQALNQVRAMEQAGSDAQLQWMFQQEQAAMVMRRVFIRFGNGLENIIVSVFEQE
ncbi:Tox-REase-5 domain-containing protein [Rhodococcus erythropolis]